jgi:5'(3')-deoxyribonucleotidase
MPDKEIYLDMDGVCVDFMSAVLRTHGMDPEGVMADWATRHRGEVFPQPLIGMEPQTFFTNEAMADAAFWSSLVPYAWFDVLFEEMSKIGHVIFLTAPTGAPGCVAGKHIWLKDKFGNDFQDFIFTRHKERLAHGSAFLVDDLAHNTQRFMERDGHGVLFPQIWNRNADIGDKVNYVIEYLRTGVDPAPFNAAPSGSDGHS